MESDQIFLSPEETRALDHIATVTFRIPSLLLMEHASLALAAAARRRLGPPPGEGPVLCIAGRGNNGGDALAAARHLRNAGYKVSVLLSGPPPAVPPPPLPPNDAATNFVMLSQLDVPISIPAGPAGAARCLGAHPPVALVLDGLLGTGLTGPVREPMLSLVRALAERPPGPILAVDIPSGLSGDTGQPMPIAVRAEETLTFAFPKAGFRSPGAQFYLGRVLVVDIGLPLPMKQNPRAYLPPL
ncbi:MAG: NAD(P)H-hydrate epimerase [Planctomycetota bacterium]